VLALTGDPIQVGDHREHAKQVFHLESTRLLELIHAMNDGKDATGKVLRKGGTGFTVGAALNPLKLSKMAQQNRLRAKLERGVHFFQTQPVYDAEPIEQMNGILEEACLGGRGPVYEPERGRD
jgi:5,10-methylenetetrahydrofolate reductase